MRFAAITRVSKNAGMLMLGTVVRMVFVFGFVIYATRVLGLTNYGKFALTQNLFELGLSLSATGLGILVTREVAKHTGWLSHHFSALIVLGIVLSVGTGLLLIVAAALLKYPADTRFALAVATLALTPAALCAISEAIFIAHECAGLVASGVALESLVRTTLWFVVLFQGFGLIGLFLVLIVTRWAQLAYYAWLLSRMLPPIEWRLRKRTLWTLARLWRIFAAETWLATLYQSLDSLLIAKFAGEDAVGLYDAAWKLIRFGPVIANSLTSAMFPYISKLYVNSRDIFQQISEQLVKYILVIVLPAVLAITIYADRIVALLFDEQFAASTPVLRVLAWLLVPQFLNPFLSRVLYAQGQQRRTVVVAAVGLATFLALAFVLIPEFGAVGAAWTAVVSSYVALASYVGFCTLNTSRGPLLTIFLRQFTAGAVLCLALLLLKQTQIVTVVLAGVSLYAFAIIALRIVTMNDVKLLAELG